MARTLRDLLTAKSVSLTHTESLELVARMLGFHDWNELSAKIQSESEGDLTRPATPIPASAAPLVARADLPVVPVRDSVLLPQVSRWLLAEENRCYQGGRANAMLMI